MNVYSVRHDGDKFEPLSITEMSQIEQLNLQPIGAPFKKSLGTLKVEKIPQDDEGYVGPLPAGDFFGLGAGAIAISQQAVRRIGDILLRYGELLPVDCPDRQDALVWFHCTTVIDALNRDLTIGKYSTDGRLFGFDRLWFYPAPLLRAAIFQVPESHLLLCTDQFRDTIAETGLTGLTFQLRWSDEPDGRRKLGEWEQRAYKGRLPPLPLAWPQDKDN